MKDFIIGFFSALIILLMVKMSCSPPVLDDPNDPFIVRKAVTIKSVAIDENKRPRYYIKYYPRMQEHGGIYTRPIVLSTDRYAVGDTINLLNITVIQVNRPQSNDKGLAK